MMFSVIIPAYNAERYLPECLESVQKQTFRDYEVIIVDDGSVDSTGAITDRFVGEAENAIVLHGSNEGLLLARRRGLLHAKGEYVVFLDSDDMLRPDALGVLSAAIGHSKVDIVSFEMTRKPGFMSSDSSASLEPGLYQGERFTLVQECVCRGRFNSLWGKAIRTSCIDVEADYGAYRGLMHGEDLFQLLPIVDRSSSLVRLDDVLYYYRPNDAASTARYRHSQLTDIVRVSVRLREFAQKWGGACVEAAAVGEAEQYINLLKMVEEGDSAVEEKAQAFEEIRISMEREGVFPRAIGAPQRLDNYLIVVSLSKRRISFARFVIRSVELAKRVREMRPRNVKCLAPHKGCDVSD